MDRERLAKEILKGEDEQGIKDHRNGYKTVCLRSVLDAFVIGENEYQFAQTPKDVVGILEENGWKVQRSGNNLNENKNGRYLVVVAGHASLVHISNGNVEFVIDTDNETTLQEEILITYRISWKK